MSGVAAPSMPAGGPPGVCDICGAADSLGLGTCAGCGAGRADALLFLRRAARRADRERTGAWLAEAVPGGVAGRDAREAGSGVRPVVRLPAPAAGRAAAALTLRGIPAVALKDRAAWRRVPVGLALLAVACAGAGVWAGLWISTPMLALGPVFGALLLRAAWREVRKPVWRPDPSPVLGLPGGVESEVRATLAALPEGRARTHLRDLSELATAMMVNEAGPMPDELATATEQLLELSCRAAIDLDRLDRALAVLDRQESAAAREGDVTGAARSARATRARLDARFEEALASLARAGTAATGPARELARLAERLASDAGVWRASWEEVRRLVG